MGTFQLYSRAPEWGAGCAGDFKFYKNSWKRSFRWLPSWWTQWSAGRVVCPNSTWTFARDLCELCPLYLFIWLFMCLLCKDTKVNAFFVDISNVSYWVLWATWGNYWTLGEFHQNSKFKAFWSEIYNSGICDWHLNWGQSCETETFTSSQYLMSKMIWIAEYPVIVWRIRDLVVGVGKHIGQYTMLILLNKIPEISYVLLTFSCELCWLQTEFPCLFFFLSTFAAYPYFSPFIFKKYLFIWLH